MKLRIAFVIASLNRTKGGLERTGANLASNMASRGHEVTVFSRDGHGNIPVYPLHENTKLMFYKSTLTNENANIVRRSLLSLKLDVCVPMFSWAEAQLWPVALQNTGIPFIYSEHSNPIFIENERMGRLPRLAVMAGADYVRLLLPSYLNSLPDEIRQRAVVIPNPVFPALHIAKPSEPINGRFRCVAIGRVVENIKQFTILVKAFDIVCKRHPKWDLCIYGYGKDEELLKSAVDAANNKKQIFFMGITHQPHLEYINSHLFCMPSRYEGFPGALTEALAHGLPSVGFKSCSGVNYLIKNNVNGLLAPEMSETSLAESLDKLMSDDFQRKQMGSSAVFSVKEFEPESIYNQWEKLLYNAAELKNNTQMSSLNDEGVRSKIFALKMLEMENIFENKLTKPLVTVVIAVYNAMKYLPECLRSLFYQTLNNFEVLFIDDASTDGSYEYLCKVTKDDCRIKVYRLEQNLGPGNARNFGIDKVRSKYFVIMDPDDFLPVNSLKYRYDLIEEDESQAAYCSAVCFLENTSEFIKKQTHIKSKKIRFDVDVINNYDLMLSLFNGHWACIFDTDFIKENKCKYSHLRAGQDVCFLVHVLLFLKTASMSPEIVYNYRVHDESTIQRLCSSGKFISLINLYESIYALALKKDRSIADLYMCKVLKDWFIGHLKVLKYVDEEELTDTLILLINLFKKYDITNNVKIKYPVYFSKKIISSDVIYTLQLIDDGDVNELKDYLKNKIFNFKTEKAISKNNKYKFKLYIKKARHEFLNKNFEKSLSLYELFAENAVELKHIVDLNIKICKQRVKNLLN